MVICHKEREREREREMDMDMDMENSRIKEEWNSLEGGMRHVYEIDTYRSFNDDYDTVTMILSRSKSESVVDGNHFLIFLIFSVGDFLRFWMLAFI